MLSTRWASILCIPITDKLHRSRLLLRSEPSKRHLARFSATVAQTTGRDMAAVAAVCRIADAGAPRWANVLHSPETVIAWMVATMHLKDLKHTAECSKAFATIFSQACGVEASSLMANLKQVHWELLRRARVRLDCTAMLLFRALWYDLMAGDAAQQTYVYLFTDASPQWRGLELFASSFDMMCEGRLLRKMLPMVSLRKEFMDSVGKCMAMLWQIFLMTGPTYGMVKAFCSRVRSITTDQGVERMLANFPCVLPDFFQGLVDGKYQPPQEPRLAMLFPKAVSMPGWMHMWDLVIRRGLCTPRYFPKWLVGLKAVVAFMRKSTYIEALARSLRQKGLHGAADLLAFASLLGFAEWRWGTLRACAVAVSKFIDTLRVHFDMKLFADSRDRTGIKNLMEALGSKSWRSYLHFVCWFTDWLGTIMSWGQGCPCHGVTLVGDCSRKGRRIREAHQYATVALRRGLDEANTWTAATWGCGLQECLEMQAAVRASFRIAEQKIAFLDRIPYLLARLGEPGVRARCLEQWGRCAADEHHRVSKEFLDPTGELRRGIDEMTDDGGGMSPKLKAEVDSLAAIPMDDTVAESPHAIAHKLVSHGRAAKWPCVAGTMRLRQNLVDAENIPQAVEVDLAKLWGSYTSVLRGPSSKRPGRPLKKKPRVFQADVYTMDFALTAMPSLAIPPGENDDPGVPGGGAGGLGGGGGGSFGSGGGGGPLLKRRRQHVGGGGSHASGGDGGALGAGAGGHDIGGGRRQRSEWARLMREYLAASLKPNDFISFPMPTDGQDNKSQFL